MKKLLIVMVSLLMVLATSITALGLNSPSVSKGSGVITGMFATEDKGVLLGLEYGLSEKFAITGRVGMEDDFDYSKLALKYEVSPHFAILGGVYEYIFDQEPYFGINGSVSFDRDISGVFEAGVIMADDVEVVYEAGIKYNVNREIDIRFGVLGSTYKLDDTAFEMGAGFKF